MTVVKVISVLSLSAMLAACGSQQTTTRAVSDPKASGGVTTLSFVAADAPKTALPPVSVRKISIDVPRSLEVSEANRYLPAGDIVWREDPAGDRYAQVEAIFDAGFKKGTQTLNGNTPVSLYVQVMRFHALTEKARYSTGGVHSIKFGLAVRDLNSGRIIGEPRIIEADLKAFGGNAALAAEAEGRTQKTRITDHLATVIQEELTQEEGHKNARLGIIQELNKF